MSHVVWHGTADEALALLAAVNQHCACRKEHKRVVAPCPAHEMLARDQRAIDGLLFMRHMLPRLMAQEFAPTSTGPNAPVAAGP
jgi:hypothetical protein